ncbi:MAG: hypothetical protein AB7E32_09945 [Desulfovibrio sp.]
MNFVVVYEDIISFESAAKIISSFPQHTINNRIHSHGFGNIKKNIIVYNKSAHVIPFFIITDLDRHTCAPSLIAEWFGQVSPAEKLIFRVAVREIESWLLADRDAAAEFLGVSSKKIHIGPDEIQDPKQFLINLAQSSRKRLIREGITPINSSPLGPLYNDLLSDFIRMQWSPERARVHSPSLNRAMNSLDL